MHCCTVRLACLIHAASVRSEPGSNSPYKNYFVADKFVCAFLLFQKVEFTFDSNFPYQNSTVFASLFEFDSGHSHYSIFQGTPDFAIRCISIASSPSGAEQRVLNISQLSDFSSGIRKIFHFSFIRNFAFPDLPDSISSLMIIAVLRREV